MSELRRLSDEERIGKKVISASGLIEMMKSPKHYRSKYVLKEIEASKAMEDGKTIHMAVLEKEKFKTEYMVLEERSKFLETVEDLKNRITSHGKEPAKGKKQVLIDQLLTLEPDAKIWDNYISTIPKDKKIISADEYKTCERIIQEISNHDWLSRIPENKSNEVPLYYKHPSGVYISCRLDSLFFGKNNRPVIIDLKKSRSADPSEFAKTIWNNRLFVQAAIYVDAIKDITGVEPLYCWVVVEDKAPYCVEVYAANDAILSAGHNVYNKQILRYLECLELDKWPGYTNGNVNPIDMPAWAFSKLDEYADLETEHG